MSSQPAFEAAITEARAAMQAGRLDVARRALKAAERAQSKSPQPWLMRADVARAEGDLEDFQRALGKARDLIAEPALRVRLDVDRGWALMQLGLRRKALEVARAAAAGLGADPRYAGPLGALLDALDAPEEAAPLLEQAAAQQPNQPEPWFDLAVVRRSLGETEAAQAACERAIALRPASSEAHALLSTLKRWTLDENHVERLRDVSAAAPPGLERSRIGYALFKELDDLGERAEAWRALEAASAEARRVYRWSADEDRRLVEALKARPGVAGALPKPRTPRQIFVVGLPRSGTSLIERILDAHTQVQALGELGAFGALVNAQLGAEPQAYVDAGIAERLGQVDWTKVGEAYREAARRLAPGAAVTVDKLPQNWLYAGAITRALPDAVMVHTNRSPLDNLFGAYRQLFQADFYWSYALEDLAAHYAHYRELTAHWRERLGGAWVEVDYEALASDPAAEVPKLLAACRLPFESACLTPERAQGRARSLSVLQLREPINTRGIGAWKAYAEELEPLRARLQAMGLIDAAGDAVR